MGGTSSPSTGTAVGSKPIRALLKVLRNIDVTAEPDFGTNFIPRIKTPVEILGTALRIQNPAQTFYTNFESAAILQDQSIKIPIITATESSAKKDEVVLLKQTQSLENKKFPTYYDVTETAAPANPAAGTLRIYANSTTHELTQRDSTGTEKKISDGTGGGGGGAPTNVPYLTLASDATLTVERVLTASGRVSITDAGANSTATLDIVAGSIVDSQIGTHTSSKITITSKSQLNSQIAYKDDTNWITNSHVSDGTFNWAKVSKTGSLFDDLGDVTITTAAAQDLIQRNSGNTAWINLAKGSNNTLLGINGSGVLAYTTVGDANIASHTSTKITITAKGQLNSAILYSDVDNALGSHYYDITEMAAPANPAAGTLRIYANSTTHELTQRDSSGTERKFSDGSGGAGAPTNVPYLTLSSDATLSAERVATASSRVTITDAGANSTATFDIGSGSITDTYIGSHTSTKISITAKGQLNSAIVYNDQTNTFGDFDQVFRDNRLRINNPADTFSYTIIAAAIGANRNLTLPLLTGNDTVVAEAFAQPLTNKTIDFASNTGTNIGDSAIAAHTSTKVTITAKGQLNSSIAYIDQANVFSDNDQSFRSTRLRVSNPANTFFYNWTGAAIAANRTIILPLLTGNDTAVMEAFAQTLTNKTMSGSSNTFTNLGDSAIAAHTSTKITITAKGQLNSAILYSDVDNALGAHYLDIDLMAAPSNPAAGKLRIFANTATGELSQKNSSGTVVKLSDGSGGGGITASSVDTLTNKTIDLGDNVVIYAGSYTYTLYRKTGSGTIYCRNNKTGAVTSNANLDPLITTVLASGDPSFEVLPGFYNLHSSFAGWTAVTKMEAFFHTDSVVNVPQGFSSVVWDFDPTDTVIYRASIEGGLWSEQGTPTNSWTFLRFAPVSTNPPTTTGAVYDCRFKNIEVWDCDKVIHINTTNKSWVNQNYFEHIYGEGMKYLFYGQHTGTYTADQSGMQENKFIDVSCQATPAGGGHAQVLGGFTGIFGQRNVFIGCTPWDVEAANSSAPTGTITANASANIIIGGLITSRLFTDVSTGGLPTIISDPFQGLKHGRAEFQYSGGADALTVYRPTTTAFSSVSIAFDELSSTGVRRTFGKITASDDSRTNGAETTWFGVEYMIGGTSAVRGAFYNNGLFFGPSTGTRVLLDNTGISGSNKSFTFPNSSGELTVNTATQNLTNKTLHGTNWRVTAKSADATLAADESIVPVSASGANRTMTLPAAASSTNKVYIISKSDSSANTVTVDGNASETINGALTFVLTQQYQSVVLWCDGSAWFTHPNSTERTGKAVANGNASTTLFNIAHGLGATPSNALISIAKPAILATYTVDGTNIAVTFTTAPASGTNNVEIHWRAVV